MLVCVCFDYLVGLGVMIVDCLLWLVVIAYGCVYLILLVVCLVCYAAVCAVLGCFGVLLDAFVV